MAPPPPAAPARTSPSDFRWAGEIPPGPRDLPVLGAAVGGLPESFEFSGQIHEYIERPPQLVGVPNGYGLYVVGDSMEPRFAAGEIVYVSPNRPVTRGCYVVIQLADGSGMLKRFVSRDNDKVVLEQLNPSERLEQMADHVEAVHRIVGQGEP